jgi:ribosomal protein S1
MVKILRIDPKRQRIGLSRRQALDATGEEEPATEE